MKHWIQAFRLRTLPLALSCILAGHASASLFVEINWLIFTLCISTTIFLQVLSNLANDYGDSENGADHEGREGPSRAVQAGLITKSAMKNAVIICSLLSLVSGVALLYVAIDEIDYTFLGFLILGLASIAAAIKYTMGKNPYGYKAMGDLFVFIFFGLVGGIGTAWLQTKTFEIESLYVSVVIGLYSVAVLNMNNMRDVDSDRIAGKKTIPMLLGDKDKWYHVALILVASIILLFFNFQYVEGYIKWLNVLLILPFVLNLKTVLSFKNRQELDPELKKIALTTFANSVYLFSVLFSQS
jgi:1,4-dihydroxy-2-naphthoate octaprenyltransferase